MNGSATIARATVTIDDRLLVARSSRWKTSQSLGRTNDQWRHDLQCVRCPSREVAVMELTAFLRSGLAKALGTDVREEDLEDFTQEAIIRILGALDSFRGDSSFTTWAMAIALRVAYTTLRRRRSAHVSLEAIGEEAVTAGSLLRAAVQDAERRVEQADLLDALRRAIVERLTVKQRTVIMAELQGVTSERTADLMGTTRNAVYKVYHDARKKLREALNQAGFTDEDVREVLAQLG